MRDVHYWRLLKTIEQMFKICDPEVVSILDRALSGNDITVEECVKLLEIDTTPELRLLEMVADFIRWRICDDFVTFVVNRNINFTNICVLRCKFCAFSVHSSSTRGYVLSIEKIREKVREALRFGITEVCIQGGINPQLDLDYYISILRAVKEEAPHVHVHAFSPQEIDYLSRKSNLPVSEVLKILHESGLDSMPGTAAEILDDEVRKIICPHKISVHRWIEIVKTAHRMGIKTTATIMYGHVENYVHIARHLDIIRNIQRETRGFTEFVLLPFIHYRTDLYRVNGIANPSGLLDVKLCAVARIFLQNYIKNIQVSWVKLGRRFAQYLLTCGANDLGGTLIEENITHAAGTMEMEYILREEFIKLIREVRRIPAERTTLYKIVRIYAR